MAFIIKDITNPARLFGRKALLDSLMETASSKANAIIIGARRFGKTSLVKCTQTLLNNLPEEEKKVIDVYMDLKSDNIGPDKDNNISGASASYSYMIAKLVAKLYQEGLYTEYLPEYRQIHPSSSWEEIYVELESLRSVILSGLLERIIKDFAALTERTILFIIDEYEYMFLHSFDKVENFMGLRTLSSQSDEAIKYFSFWLVGSTTGVEFDENNPGSGVTNTVQNIYFVPPIAAEDFNAMWMKECEEVANADKRQFLIDNMDYAREKSGCVPCYGKDLIGGYMQLHTTLPDYTVCNKHFKELFDISLSKEEAAVLKHLASGPKRMPNTIVLNTLKQKGLVRNNRNDSSRSEIAIPFLQDYINSLPDAVRNVVSDAEVIEASVLRSMELINRINKQRLNREESRVFELVDNASIYERQMRTVCNTADKLKDFCTALYNTFFERSENNRPRCLFQYFDRSRRNFAQYADLARHTFGQGHDQTLLERYNGRITYAELLEILTGSTNEPATPEEFKCIQKKLLDEFEITLNSILNELRSFR